MLVTAVLFFLFLALAQGPSDRPAVYVPPQETVFAGDIGTRVAKEVQHNKACQGVTVTVREGQSDYTLNVGRVSFGWNWTVAGKDGALKGSGGTKRVKNAVKDACRAILSDWNSGRKPD